MNKYTNKNNGLNIFSIENLYIAIFVSIFLFSDFFRRYIISLFIDTNMETLYNINYIFVLLIIIFLIKYKKNIDKKYMILTLFLLITQILNLVTVNYRLKYLIFDIIFIVVPLMLFSIELTKDKFTYILKVCLNILNIFVIIVLILGVIDYLTNRGIQYFLNDIGFFDQSYSILLDSIRSGQHSESFRYISIFGHPLRNAQLFISFYILNFLGNKNFYKPIVYISFSIILVLGVILSNGKTAMIISIFLVLYTLIYKTKKISIKDIIITAFAGILVFNTSVFKNTVLSRFKEAIESKDLASGRNVIFKFIAEKKVVPPSLLGYGEGFSNYIIEATNQNIASLEYPFMVFAYDKGLLFTIIFYLIILLPLINLLKNKQYNIVFMYLIFNGYVNIYNGIAIHGDYLPQYILINIFIYYIGMYKIKI